MDNTKDALCDFARIDADALAKQHGASRDINGRYLFRCVNDLRRFAASACKSAKSAEEVRRNVLPPEVIAWHEAEQARIDAVHAYNDRVAFVRKHCPFGTSVEPEYELMEEARREAHALIKPMFDAISIASAQGAQDKEKER